MPRKVNNWLDGFLVWTKPRSESPDSFLLITGLFTLACAVRKHVKIPKYIEVGGKKEGILGAWECYPNLYTVIVGEPGIARKSTTLDFGESLLNRISNVPSAPTEISQAALMSAIAESHDGSIYIAATELEELVRKTPKEMWGFLTSGFDVRRSVRSRTIKRGAEIVPNFCVNLFACTQPGWIKENMPSSVIKGGFASRTLFVYEEEPGKLEIFYDDDLDVEIDYEAVERMEGDLVEDLEHIANIKGEFNLPKNVRRKVREWYKGRLQEELKGSDPRLKGYYARKHVHLLKIAMLMHLSYSDELVILEEDIDASLNLLNSIEPNMIRIFGSIGKNEYNLDIDSIGEYVKINKKAPLSELVTKFQASAEPQKLIGLIDFLVIKKLVKVNISGNEPVYEWVGG